MEWVKTSHSKPGRVSRDINFHYPRFEVTKYQNVPKQEEMTHREKNYPEM